MFSLTYDFEGLPLIQHNGLLAEVTATGRAEIEYADDGGWCIDRIFVAARNGEAYSYPAHFDGEIEIERTPTGHATVWWTLIHDALITRWDAIEEQVALALQDDGLPLPGLDDGNRLTAADLGLARQFAAPLGGYVAGGHGHG